MYLNCLRTFDYHNCSLKRLDIQSKKITIFVLFFENHIKENHAIEIITTINKGSLLNDQRKNLQTR